jgi:multisubunit Na+/H+ antiporter MnhB subunit
LIALLLYLGIAWLVLPSGAPWSPDEGAKYLQLTSLRLEAGRLALDIPYPGAGLDPELEFTLREHPKDLLRVAGGKLVLERLPLFPMLVWPLYAGLGNYALPILPAVLGALSAVLALSLLPRGDRRVAMWALIAFGSPVFIYSLLFWEHTLAVSLALAGAWLLLHELSNHEQRALCWILGACLLAAAVYIRLEAALFAGALLAACWLLCADLRRWTLLAGLAFLLLLLPYRPTHRALFQNQPLPVNARYLNLPLAYLRHAQWRAIPDLLVGPPDEEGIHPGWLGGLWSAAALAAIAPSFKRQPTPATLRLQRLGLALSGLTATYFLFTPTPYRAAHGLLFTTPWTLLGFTRRAEVWSAGGLRARILLATAYLGLGGYALAILGLRGSSPQGGLEWGARFALTFYPLLALAAAWDWRTKPRIDRWIIVALIILGMGFQVRGLASIRSDLQTNRALNQVIAELPGEPVLTDLWWLALNAAPVYADTPLYTIKSPQEGAAWIAHAQGRDIRQFSLVTLDHALPAHISSHLEAPQIAILELIQVGDLLIFRLEIGQSEG